MHALKVSSLQNVETGQDTEDERTKEEEAKAPAFTIRCCNIQLALLFFSFFLFFLLFFGGAGGGGGGGYNFV